MSKSDMSGDGIKDKLPQFFDEFVAKMMPLIRENANEKQGVAPVAFVGSSETSQFGIVALDFSGRTQDEVVANKDKCGHAIRRIAKQMFADFVIFVSESWTIPQDQVKEFMDNRHLYPSIESFPGRIEMVMISVETKTDCWIGSCSLSGVQGDRTVGDPKFLKADSNQGRFTHFLGPKAVVN